MNSVRVFCVAVLVGAALLLAGCPKTDKPIVTPPTGDPVAVIKSSEMLEDIPVDLRLDHKAPMTGHDAKAAQPILDYMTKENQRAMGFMTKTQPSAYYLAYRIHDQRRVSFSAEGGAVRNDTDNSDRFLEVNVRVGSMKMDNLRPLSNDPRGINQPMIRRSYAPLGSDRLAVQSALWVETDRRFREALLQHRAVVLDNRLTSTDKPSPPDFVGAPKEEFVQPLATLSFDKAAWLQRLKVCSKKAKRKVVTRATCSVDFELNTVYFVNSEGTRLQMSWPTARLAVSVAVKADDGTPLSRVEQRFARTPAELPSDADIEAVIRIATDDLAALHKSEKVDPYVGPAILEGRAAAVFFHEVFGHRIEGHRQKGLESGKTFTSKVGQVIMPKWLSVYDDPTVRTLNKRTLNGFYHFDDEGVRAQKANLVENGILRGFIMGRNPIENFPNSNGHGRTMGAGHPSVSRQGNLVVSSTKSVTDKDLYKGLIEEVKRQGKPFGMVFTDISGGFTNTTSFAPQSFKVHPTLAYRVYPDGRKEMVRGVDIVGTPLTALGSIMAAGRSMQTFNGVCGAESGWVPVSASAPSLLLSKLEVERVAESRDRSPVLPPPSIQSPTKSATGAK